MNRRAAETQRGKFNLQFAVCILQFANCYIRGSFAAVFLILCHGCGAPDPNTIKIVSSLPRTGSARQQSGEIVNGIRMAMDDADDDSAQPGCQIAEYTIEYRDLDDATAIAGTWTSERETANAIQASQDPDVMAYIGTFNSGAAKVALPILNRAGVLMISPANTAVELTNPELSDPRELAGLRPSGRINFCRIVPGDDIQSLFAAEWTKELGFRRVVALDDNEVYGKGVALLYAENCQRLGIEVVYRDSIDVKSQEFRSLMTKIKSYEPDLIFFGGTTQSKGGQLVKDMVAAGLSSKMMVPDGCYEQAFIDSAGADNANDRVYVTFGGLPPSEQTGRGREFVIRYQQQFGATPDVYAVYGYEAAQVVLAAIRRAGKKDRAAILEACLATKDFEGALGTWSFDKNGDITNAQLSGNVIRNGEFVFVKKWRPGVENHEPRSPNDETSPNDE
jgi:branched-chain amino acid transport system substrate-binding protein